MEPLQIGHVVSRHWSTDAARSALPDAPVVPYREGLRPVARTRAAVAGTLHRLADIVAPARPAGRASGQLPACRRAAAH